MTGGVALGVDDAELRRIDVRWDEYEKRLSEWYQVRNIPLPFEVVFTILPSPHRSTVFRAQHLRITTHTARVVEGMLSCSSTYPHPRLSSS